MAVDGSRRDCTSTLPSSSRGMNSRPRLVAAQSEPAKSATAVPMTAYGWRIVRARSRA
jgi:hypothetical protein